MSVPELVLNHQVIRELLTGDKAREGMLLRMVLAGKAMGSTPVLPGFFLLLLRRPVGRHRVTWKGSFALKGKMLLTSSCPQTLLRKELQTILELEKRGLKWRAIWSPGSQSKLISNLRQWEKRDGELWTMLLALVSRRAGSRACPYMLELELVSPLTTMLHPGQIPSGCRASNCRRRRTERAGTDPLPHSVLTLLSHIFIVIFSLSPSNTGTHSIPVFFSLLNNLRDSKLIRNQVSMISSWWGGICCPWGLLWRAEQDQREKKLKNLNAFIVVRTQRYSASLCTWAIQNLK